MIIALVVTATLASAQVALAAFTHAVAGGPQAIATSTLSAPKEVTADQVNCRTNKSPEIEVSWSATSSSYATSYTVERASASAGPYTLVASPAISEKSYTDKSASLAASTTYYYRVSAVYRSWSATSAVALVKTLSKSCL